LLAYLFAQEDTFLGLVTGNIEEGARMKLDHVQLNEYFPIGAYGSDSADRLDLPAIAVERASKYFEQQFLQDDVLIVGDSVNDILCAKHYGARCLAVNTGKTPWDELADLKPEFLFKDLSDTQGVIAAIYADAIETDLPAP
jgi:phosphoglycolate phosphatase-like HAD superfamily hydrolase